METVANGGCSWRKARRLAGLRLEKKDVAGGELIQGGLLTMIISLSAGETEPSLRAASNKWKQLSAIHESKFGGSAGSIELRAARPPGPLHWLGRCVTVLANATGKQLLEPSRGGIGGGGH